MNRIRNLFKKDKDKLIVFLTAGYPEINSTEKLVLTAVESGADMIEIGIPFSDPQADGPIIQKASEKALSNGITLDIIFQQVKSIRKKTNIPISLMGYYNPILKRGIDRFLADCVVNEIDGIILPDLPYDEGKEFCNKAKQLGISPILLVAPNTSNKRIEEISNLSNDLISEYSTTPMYLDKEILSPYNYDLVNIKSEQHHGLSPLAKHHQSNRHVPASRE